jgi:hypothetical protein
MVGPCQEPTKDNHTQVNDRRSAPPAPDASAVVIYVHGGGTKWSAKTRRNLLMSAIDARPKDHFVLVVEGDGGGVRRFILTDGVSPGGNAAMRPGLSG